MIRGDVLRDEIDQRQITVTEGPQEQQFLIGAALLLDGVGDLGYDGLGYEQLLGVEMERCEHVDAATVVSII